MAICWKKLFRTARTKYQQIQDGTTTCLHVLSRSIHISYFLVYCPLVGVSDKGKWCLRIAKWYQKCLTKFYYLYNKSTEKLRSLKKLIQTWHPCGLNWQLHWGRWYGTYQSILDKIGHLVKGLQYAIDKFGVYLTDNTKIRAKTFGYVRRWQGYWHLLGMGFFLHMLIPLKELSLGWQKKILTAVV